MEGVRHNKDRIRSMLRSTGIRCTRQRELIFDALASTELHPTAEELHRMARAQDRRLSLATVYNTLVALTQAGLIRRLPAQDSGPARFDADASEHLHAVASDGRILDVPEDLARRILDAVTPELRAEIAARLKTPIGRLTFHLLPSPTSGAGPGR